MLTAEQQCRLARIRADLEKHRALGHDVDSWEATFFLELIEQYRKQENPKQETV